MIKKKSTNKKKRKNTSQGKKNKATKREKSAKKKKIAGRKVSKKKTAKKTSKPKLVGRVTHYFDKIKVAAIKLTTPLKEGDRIQIIGGEDTDFKQTVKSMEIEHKKVKKAQKGKEIGLKIAQKVREGYKVYKI